MTTISPSSQLPAIVARPIRYRVEMDAAWKQLAPFLFLAALYLSALTMLWLQHHQPVIFDPLSILFAIAIPVRMISIFFHRRQRRRFQNSIIGTETLFASCGTKQSLRRARLISGILCFGMILLMAASLWFISTHPAPLPALWWFYPPFLLVHSGAILVTARSDRVRIVSTGIVQEDRLFQTFYPWASLKELTWISDTKKLRIECRDIPDWRTVSLTHLTDAERDQFLELIEQHAPLQRA